MAASYGRRMAALGRYRHQEDPPDRKKLAAAFEADMLKRMGAKWRLERARDEALRAGVGRAEIEELLHAS
jgi:hypothetical protein